MNATPPAPDPTDLLRRAAGGDQGAFRALHAATQPKLFGVALRILARRDAASDAVQEAYVKIWRRAADFDPAKGSAVAWMATITRNVALDAVRKTQPISLEDMPDGFEPAAEAVDPLAGRERSERLSALMKCLEELEPRKREMVLLAYWHGASRDALAAKYSAPAATIKTWLRRSLLGLRECMET
ncbi:MAG: sigma-70 family RNA polymerase sigma factor [Hyphomicrobiales bacterium]|nr:sigma-70 family RNA polymerase sigma factor [Hyphomicrobiales bacterium]